MEAAQMSEEEKAQLKQPFIVYLKELAAELDEAGNATGEREINTGRRLGRGRDVRSGRAVRQGQRDPQEGEGGTNQCLNQIVATRTHWLIYAQAAKKEKEAAKALAKAAKKSKAKK